MTTVTEVVTDFSFTGDPSKLEGYNENLGTSIKLLSGFTVATFAAAAGVAAWTMNILSSLDPLVQLSTNTGVATGEIQTLGFIASQTGSDLGAVTSTLDSLTTKIGDAANRGSADFARLGISVRDSNGEIKKADQIMNEVRGSFKRMGLSMVEQRTFAASLGIDPSLLQMMNKTDKELNKLSTTAKKYGVITKEQSEQIVKVNDKQAELKFGLSAISREIALGISPMLLELAGYFLDVLAANKGWIVEGITVGMKVIKSLMAAFMRLLPVMAIMAGAFGILQVAALGLGGVLGAVFSPVVLITAGIVLLILIIDDLIVAFSGGKSVIADFFSEFLGIDIVSVITEQVNGVITIFTFMGSTVMSIFNIMKEFITSIMSGVGEDINTSVTTIMAIFDTLKTAVMLPIKVIGMLLRGEFLGAFKVIEQAATSLFNKIVGVFEPLVAYFDTIVAKIKKYASIIPGIDFDETLEQPATQPSAIVGGSLSNATNNNQKSVSQEVTMNIHTSNPEETTLAVKDGLQTQLREANDLLQRGA